MFDSAVNRLRGKSPGVYPRSGPPADADGKAKPASPDSFLAAADPPTAGPMLTPAQAAWRIDRMETAGGLAALQLVAGNPSAFVVPQAEGRKDALSAVSDAEAGFRESDEFKRLAKARDALTSHDAEVERVAAEVNRFRGLIRAAVRNGTDPAGYEKQLAELEDLARRLNARRPTLAEVAEAAATEARPVLVRKLEAAIFRVRQQALEEEAAALKAAAEALVPHVLAAVRARDKGMATNRMNPREATV